MGRRSGTLNVLSQHWKHSKAAVTAVRHGAREGDTPSVTAAHAA